MLTLFSNCHVGHIQLSTSSYSIVGIILCIARGSTFILDTLQLSIMTVSMPTSDGQRKKKTPRLRHYFMFSFLSTTIHSCRGRSFTL